MCDLCKIILGALCKRFEPMSWVTPAEYLGRIPNLVEDPGIYLYSYMYAEDARDTHEEDELGTFPIYQGFRLGIGLSPPGVHTIPFVRLAGMLQLVSTSCDSLGLEPDFYGRIIHPERANMQLAKEWLEECVFAHDSLCDAHTRPCPNDLRVIDVDRMQLLPLPPGSEYVTLSYRWGASKRHFTTTSSNITELEVENSLRNHFHQLPQTIQDAIDCVRELGERFLWVDAICIVQDSPEDKDHFIRQMDRIYENSLVTIIAAPPSESVGYPLPDGLPGYRAGTRQFAQDKARVQGLDICTSFLCIQMALVNCPWNDRAWTFQEELLSKRRLYFTGSQLYFQCFCGVLCEDVVGEGKSPSAYFYSLSSLWNLAGLYTSIGEGQAGWAQGLSRAKFQTKEKAVQYYQTLVERYTERDITHQGDALVALDGVLMVLGQTLDTQFVFGLPEAHFDDAVLWVTRRPCKRRQATSNALHRKNFPSWTWAGWEAQSCYRGNSVGHILPEASWFLVTEAGDVTRLATSWPRDLSCTAGLLEDSKHRDISPNDSIVQIQLPNLKPRSDIRPEEVEASSLVCLTSLAVFRFQGDTIEEFDSDWPEHKNFVISDASGRAIGAMWMGNAWSEKIKHQVCFEFVLLSRAQAVDYVPELDETMFPKADWSYSNVMLVERQGKFAERLGIGVVHENAWAAACPTTMILYLR